MTYHHLEVKVSIAETLSYPDTWETGELVIVRNC